MDYCFKFIQKVSNYIQENNMIDENDNIIVGLSGGGDSVCLFLVLNELKEKFKFNLYAVHINHGIRGISAISDEMFAKALCERENVPIKSFRLNVVEKAKNEKLTLEEAGRRARYDIFYKEAESLNGAKIAVAHHINDQAETVLFNMIRGSGLKGMGGMQPVRDNIIRPLLCVTRDEIVQFLRERQEDFCTDETNEDNEYTRNLIRNKVIPILSDIQPESASHIAATADELREAFEYIEEKSRKAFDDSVKETDGGFVICTKKLNTEKPIIIRNVIIFTMQKLVDEWKDVSRVHINDVYGLIEKGRGKEIHLPKGLTAKKVTNGIYIGR